MPTCSLCGSEELSFTCPYCNGIYCSEHRLPESHGCPGMHRVREDARRKVSDSLDSQDKDVNVTFVPQQPQKRRRQRYQRKRFSSTEIRDLLIASILVILVGISIFGSPSGILSAFNILAIYIGMGLWWLPVGMIGIFLTSFMAHELAHKFAAQHYGMWSEFRMTSMGYILSAMAILFSVPIFGTGIVYTSGTTNREHNAKSNLAGPLTNFVIAAMLMIIAIILRVLAVPLGFATYFIQYGIQLNAFLGLFNMIPFQPFDGATVREWSNTVWLAQVIGLGFMLGIGYAFPYLGF
ncbi:MAG: AN1-type zinc finger domain-containing protein [Candidatus Thorarchaeota archaeon]